MLKKLLFDGYGIYINNGKVNTGKDLFKFINEIKNYNLGEIVINCIDLDGTMEGYNINLVERVRKEINMPLTILGGAGSLADIKKIIELNKVIGAAAGSLFVFKGSLKAVLINYPKGEHKKELY